MLVPQCLLLSAVLVAVSAASQDPSTPLESDDVINTVNNAKTTWTAGRNFDTTLTKSYAKNLLGIKRHPGGSILPMYALDQNVLESNVELPKSFDARNKWKYCTGLQTVRDQGPCASCWAVTSAAAFTDRLCIATSGSWNSQLSAQFLMSCCTNCGDGCNSGYPDYAWYFFKQTGLCTGGDYNSKEGCQPYTLPACDHHITGSRKNCSAYPEFPTPSCFNSSCYNEDYKTPFDKDFHKVYSTFVLNNMTDAVMWEIYKNGPVVATFDVYEDFFSYKSGVYTQTTGEYKGGHAGKVIGWGVEAGTKYWLVANSWNSDWGDGGFFKIKRGNNECYFEDNISGGLPNPNIN